MLPIDIAFLVLLSALLFSWLQTNLASRGKLLTALTLGLLISIGYGFSIQRWQLVPGLALVVLLPLFFYIRKKRQFAGDVPWITGLALAVPAAIAAFLIYTFPVFPLPAPTGEFKVGVADFELTDETRKGLLNVSGNAPRRLLIRTWYPAADITGTERRPYFTKAEATTTATGPGSIVGLPFYFTHVANARTNSYIMAKPVTDRGKLPVIFYSHGYTSFPGQNTALMEELASHGYLVFSVHHTGDSSPAVMPNGDVIPMDPEILQNFEEQFDEDVHNPFEALITGESYQIRRQANQDTYYSESLAQTRLRTVSADLWVQDREFVQKKLAALDVPAVVAHIVLLGDYKKTGEMGMSFGGTTSAALCMTNRRCGAAINLDGGDYHYNTFNRHLPVPFLMVHSDMNQLAAILTEGHKTIGHPFNEFSYERHETSGIRDDIHRVMIPNVTHIGISDFNWFVRRPFRDSLLGTIDGEDIIRIQNDLVRDFFDEYIRGRDTDFPAKVIAANEGLVIEYDRNGDLGQDWISRNPIDTYVLVTMETSLGNIELAIYPERAPVSATNFLAYVDGGHYNGAHLYRSADSNQGSGISVIQGGLASDAMSGPADDVVSQYALLPPIEHETTDDTGINNERGTIAYARFAPGTAGSEIFFNVQDNPQLDHGNTSNNRDGHGYATFGRIIRGLKILESIQDLSKDRETSIELLRGQLLTEPVEIKRVYRSGS